MNKKIAFIASILCGLAGCASIPVSSPDLSPSATAATNAATLAKSVDHEILRARLLQLVDKEQVLMVGPVPTLLVCDPSSASVILTAKELAAYADAINAVGKVAAKPADTSYAGYLQQFKKDQSAIKAADAPTPEEASDKDKKAALEAQQNCAKYLQSDLTHKLAAPVRNGAGFVATGLSATVASVDALLKAILGAAETVEREVAVHRATAHMLVLIKEATAKLSEKPEESDYTLPTLSGSPPTSRLANTLAIHRWFAAQRLEADWELIGAENARVAIDNEIIARGAQPGKAKGAAVNMTIDVEQAKNDVAAGTGRRWAAVDAFVADADAYATLTQTDPEKLLKDLQAAVDRASQSTDKTSVNDILDSLSAIGTAVAAVDSKYSALRKTL